MPSLMQHRSIACPGPKLLDLCFLLSQSSHVTPAALHPDPQDKAGDRPRMR